MIKTAASFQAGKLASRPKIEISASRGEWAFICDDTRPELRPVVFADRIGPGIRPARDLSNGPARAVALITAGAGSCPDRGPSSRSPPPRPPAPAARLPQPRP